MVLIWETWEEWKTELTLEPPNDFESGTGGLLIQTLTTRSLLIKTSLLNIEFWAF